MREDYTLDWAQSKVFLVSIKFLVLDSRSAAKQCRNRYMCVSEKNRLTHLLPSLCHLRGGGKSP